MSERDKQAGRVRRIQAMGDAFMERATSRLNAFSAPLQDWLNEHAWGSMWQCKGIDLKTCSLCIYVMLAVLGHNTELKDHMWGALSNSATAVEIREVPLYSAIYAGALAATETFRSTREALNGLGTETEEARWRRFVMSTET